MKLQTYSHIAYTLLIPLPISADTFWKNDFETLNQLSEVVATPAGAAINIVDAPAGFTEGSGKVLRFDLTDPNAGFWGGYY